MTKHITDLGFNAQQRCEPVKLNERRKAAPKWGASDEHPDPVLAHRGQAFDTIAELQAYLPTLLHRRCTATLNALVKAAP